VARAIAQPLGRTSFAYIFPRRPQMSFTVYGDPGSGGRQPQELSSRLPIS
jgi:hypothetical protein